jgi:hypothetical protein
MLRLIALGVVLAGGLLVALVARREPRSPGPPRAGGHFRIVRCPLHGIAYDAELEECPDCARATA